MKSLDSRFVDLEIQCWVPPHRVVTPVSGFTELGEHILWREFKQCNQHPSSSQSHQASLRSKELEQTLFCWQMQCMHTTSYGPSADYFQFHNYISIIPLTIPSCFIKKQRATMALCKPDEIVKEMVICLWNISSANPETGVTTQRLF